VIPSDDLLLLSRIKWHDFHYKLLEIIMANGKGSLDCV